MVMSFASIIYRVCRLLFKINEMRRPLSRFIGSRAIMNKIQDFHEELDHLAGFRGTVRSGGGSWIGDFDECITPLQARFEEILNDDAVLLLQCTHAEDKVEAATLLLYELKSSARDGKPELRACIERVLARFLQASEAEKPDLPDWFVSRDDVEFHY